MNISYATIKAEQWYDAEVSDTTMLTKELLLTKNKKLPSHFYQPGYRFKQLKRKVRTAKGNTPVKRRLPVKGKEKVPQKITVLIY